MKQYSYKILKNRINVKGYNENRNYKTVYDIDGKPNFNISYLNIMGFCEYALENEYKKGIKVPDNKAMKIGKQKHLIKEKQFKSDTRTGSLQKCLKTSEIRTVILREFYIFSKTYGVRGFIDEIHISPDNILIIDDKPNTRVYHSLINQLLAYALCVEEQIANNRPITIALRDIRNSNIFYTSQYTKTNKEQILKTINRMHKIINGEIIPKHTTNIKKCKKCRFHKQCTKTTYKP